METETIKNGTELTETESELYDRQIRLWGLESQKRLRTAKVLISGLSGIGAEVTKNIILTGVNSVVLHDSHVTNEDDFGSQFFLSRSSIGLNRAESSIKRAKTLNPLVDISADVEPLEVKTSEFFEQFDVVVIIGASNSELLRINQICREKGIIFFAGDVWGMFGYFFIDAQGHKYVEETFKHKVVLKPGGKKVIELIATPVECEMNFPPYEALLEFDINANHFQKKIKKTGCALIVLKILQKFRETFNRNPNYKSREADLSLLKGIRDKMTNKEIVSNENFDHVFSQISPAAAVVGGVLSQEMIKVITKKETPYCNVFLFDPISTVGYIETVGSSD